MTIDLIQFFKDYDVAVTAGLSLLGSLGLSGIVAAFINKRSQTRDQDLRRDIAQRDEQLRRDLGQGDLELRRRVETVKVFLTVSARAHGLREDGSAVGTGERIAALYLLADLSSRDEWLLPAGRNQLGEEYGLLYSREVRLEREARTAGQAYTEAAKEHWDNEEIELLPSGDPTLKPSDIPELRELSKVFRQAKLAHAEALRLKSAAEMALRRLSVTNPGPDPVLEALSAQDHSRNWAMYQ